MKRREFLVLCAACTATEVARAAGIFASAKEFYSSGLCGRDRISQIKFHPQNGVHASEYRRDDNIRGLGDGIFCSPQHSAAAVFKPPFLRRYECNLKIY